MEELKIKQKRYTLMFLGSAILNVLYVIVFSVENCNPLYTLCLFEAIFYVVLMLVARKATHFYGLLISCSVCMAIHTIVHMFLLGPQYGYQYIFLGFIPVIFCVNYMNNSPVKASIKSAIGVVIMYLIVMAICLFLDNPYYKIGAVSYNIICLSNVFISFGLIIAFMTILVNQMDRYTGTLKTQKNDMEENASIDTLTGLRNRKSLDMYLNKAFARALGDRKYFTILMCDIDNFKHVNDTYGHECGDLVLKNIANIFKSETREDDIVVRWGGEEILIIIDGNNYIAQKIAERCRQAIEDSEVVYKDTTVKVTITIGGASYYQGVDKDTLIGRADSNLYTGKKNGKNQVVF